MAQTHIYLTKEQLAAYMLYCRKSEHLFKVEKSEWIIKYQAYKVLFAPVEDGTGEDVCPVHIGICIGMAQQRFSKKLSFEREKYDLFTQPSVL